MYVFIFDQLRRPIQLHPKLYHAEHDKDGLARRRGSMKYKRSEKFLGQGYLVSRASLYDDELPRYHIRPILR